MYAGADPEKHHQLGVCTDSPVISDPPGRSRDPHRHRRGADTLTSRVVGIPPAVLARCKDQE